MSGGNGASCEVHYDAATRTWLGPRGKEFYGPEMTLGEVTMRVLNLNADKVLQHCDITGVELTGAELAQQGLIIAQAFRRLGLQCGDVIGISANNTSYLTGVTIAAMLSGTPINPLHPDFDQGRAAMRSKTFDSYLIILIIHRDCQVHVRYHGAKADLLRCGELRDYSCCERKVTEAGADLSGQWQDRGSA